MTERITHDLVQGSPEWEQFRLEHFGASEAAAMLGISPHVKRNELLHMKHTGTAKEFSDWVQERILDKGHEIEALARPVVEDMLSEDLYPMVFSRGRISASLDGLTMREDTAWENKQFNEALYSSIGEGVLPEEYMPQAQQVLMVSGAERLVFTCSDGTEDGTVWMEVLPDEAWFERLRAGWAQFEKDLATYEPRDIKEKPKADAIRGLPTLAVQIKGEVVASNLPRFKAAAERFIANIKTDLQTDEDFANAEETVKFCQKAEDELEVAKNAAIAQTASIDDLMRTVDQIKEQLRRKRLDLNTLVKNRKEQIKGEIVANGRAAYAKHIAEINAELKVVTIVVTAPDFITAAKNKRTLASLHEAIDTAVANGKIAADKVAKELRAKLAWYAANGEEYGFLFRDLQTLIQKPADDFQLVVTSRIDAHKQQEAEKAQKALLAEEQQMRDRGEYPRFEEALAAANSGERLEYRRMPQDQWRGCEDGHEMNAHFYYRRSQQPAPARMEAQQRAANAIAEATNKTLDNAAPAPADETPAPTTLYGGARGAGGKAPNTPRRIPSPTAAQIVDVLADYYGASAAQTAALLVTLDFKAELDRLTAEAPAA